jgi:hypothetical protein
LCPLGYFRVTNARDLMEVMHGIGAGVETEQAKSPEVNEAVILVKEMGKGSIGKASVQYDSSLTQTKGKLISSVKDPF